MTKVFLLGANKEIDRAEQVVEVNQIIQMEGYSYHRYVVYEITNDRWGITYKLINLSTKDFHTAETIRPLSQKFGVGFYYDEVKPTFLDAFEVAILFQQAEQKKQTEQNAKQKQEQQNEKLCAIGRERLEQIIPNDAKAIIIATLHQNESDTYRDYFEYSIQRTVILGFSSHTKNNFQEMRNHAGNFEPTQHLAEKNSNNEHRENHTGGDGYYLGKSKYSGWVIEKETFSNREYLINRYALTAGNEDNIRIKKTNDTPPLLPSDKNGIGKGNCTLVEYSDKAVAVFGDTKSIKDELKAMGGCFNSRLTWGGKRLAGWIFSKSQEHRLACYFGLD